MTDSITTQIALGGGCHWCTEAVFESLRGVCCVDQGWAASVGEHSAYSEAVLLDFNDHEIDLETLLEIHLLTHSSTSKHSMRGKYRSAVYVSNDGQRQSVELCLGELQNNFDKPLVTKVLPLSGFKSNEQYQNYYYQDPNKLFCQRHIAPKLTLILSRFSKHTKLDKVNSALRL